MMQIIGAIVELIIFILKNAFENNAEVKKQNDELHKQAKDAILSRDASRISNVFDKLRRK
jgi:hypothetical protein